MVMIKGINKWKGPNRSRRDSEEVARIQNCTKRVLMINIITKVWSLT